MRPAEACHADIGSQRGLPCRLRSRPRRPVVHARNRTRPPIVQAFLQFATVDMSWSQAWPRRLLELAAALGVSLTGVDRIVVLNVGFPRRRPTAPARTCARGDRPALAAAAQTAGRERFIYRDGRDLLVLGGEPRHRFGAPESILRPSLHASPAGPAPDTTGRHRRRLLHPHPPGRRGPISSPAFKLYTGNVKRRSLAQRRSPVPRRCG
jgi:hypothetical protein